LGLYGSHVDYFLDGLKAMGEMLRLMAIFLAIGTVVLTMAVVYVVGVEHGVNSQQPEIVELYHKLNPDVLINPLPYMHPLRNFLFGSALFIAICWITFFITISLAVKKKGF
jgi:polyferredoxin